MPAASMAATSLILTPRMNSIVSTRRALRAPSTSGTRTPSMPAMFSSRRRMWYASLR